MNNKIADSIQKVTFDVNELHSCHDIAKEYSPSPPLTYEVSDIYEDPNCHTAFSISFSIPNDKWLLVIEISKLGRFAKRYWRKKSFFGKTYSDIIPTKLWKENLSCIQDILERMNVGLLTEEELSESLPNHVCRDTPIGQAETVGDILFYFDGRVL